MTEFIKQYWLQFIFTGIATGFTYVLKRLYSQLRAEDVKRKAQIEIDNAEQQLMKSALLAILHDRLYQACRHYIEQGCCPLNDMKNLEYLYQGYHDLGGNGTCEELYRRCRALPLEKAP